MIEPGPAYRNPKGLRPPRGAYSHLARSASLIAISGQTGTSLDGEVPAEFADQARIAFENVRIALESEDASVRGILTLRTYLTSAQDIADFLDVRTAVFATWYPDAVFPPSTLLIVTALVRPDLRIEIEATATP